MQNYKLGVLLSAYNGEKYITQQVESIMNQNNVDHITLLVRNDGSTDDTLEILRKLEKKYTNLQVINGSNIGLIASFFELLRIGFQKFNFDYYSFSDQDDYWMKDKLESAIQYLSKENNNIPLLYGCRSVVVDEKLKPTGFLTQAQKRKLTFYNTAIQNIVIGHNQVLNKKLAKILINQKQDFSNIYSQDLWITNVAAVSGKIVFENTPHAYYRMHENNQLGYGKGKFDRIRGHLIRLRKKEPQKMAIQLRFFADYYSKYLSTDERHEIDNFFKQQDSLINRKKYIRTMKLYRQNDKETKLFKILYLIGSYNIKD